MRPATMMYTMATYRRVSMLTIELAIEECIDNPREREEIENLCRDEDNMLTPPFFHAASRLREHGYDDIADLCLENTAQEAWPDGRI